MRFGTIVLQVNMHRLTNHESDFRFDIMFSRWQP